MVLTVASFIMHLYMLYNVDSGDYPLIYSSKTLHAVMSIVFNIPL